MNCFRILFIILLPLSFWPDILSQKKDTITQSDFFEIVFRHNFENDTPGEYSKEEWERDWNHPSWANKDAGYGKIISENNNKYLRESFPPGTFLLDGSGTQWHAVFNKGYDELYLSYRVKFSDGFVSKDLHGKIPGLSGGTSNGGGYIPTGADGWSARYMFHGTDINFYLYYPDLCKHYGDSVPIADKKYYGAGPELNPGFKLQPEVWYTVTQRIVMNTPGKHDGIAEGYINGVMCAKQTGIRFRDIPTLQIDRIYFANFFGGSGKPAIKNEYISFDDFYVYTYKPWVKVLRDHNSNAPDTNILLPDMVSVFAWEKSLECSPGSKGNAELRWTAFPVSIDGYIIERKAEGSSQFSKIATVAFGDNSYGDVTTRPGKKYIYRVKAFGNEGFSCVSKEGKL